MTISPLTRSSVSQHLEQAVDILYRAFRDHWPTAWPSMDEARAEIDDLLAEGYPLLAAIDEQGNVMGWVGAQDVGYDDQYVWELHPLAVDPAHQGRGVGRVLVEAIEALVVERGGGVMMLGTDDQDDMTTLASADLWNGGLLAALQNIRNVKNHPYGFYERLGYIITGVVPDANGPGKPDILMAKRLRP